MKINDGIIVITLASLEVQWMIAECKFGPENRNNEGQCDRFVKAEKSEEWMARSPVYADDVIASEMASRHQPMNWRDSIGASDIGHAGGVPEA